MNPYPSPYLPECEPAPRIPTTNRQTLSIFKQRTVHAPTACHRRPSTAAPAAADDAPCLSGLKLCPPLPARPRGTWRISRNRNRFCSVLITDFFFFYST